MSSATTLLHPCLYSGDDVTHWRPHTVRIHWDWLDAPHCCKWVSFFLLLCGYDQNVLQCASWRNELLRSLSLSVSSARGLLQIPPTAMRSSVALFGLDVVVHFGIKMTTFHHATHMPALANLAWWRYVCALCDRQIESKKQRKTKAKPISRPSCIDQDYTRCSVINDLILTLGASCCSLYTRIQ